MPRANGFGGEGLIVGSGFDIVGAGDSEPLEYGLDSNMFRNGAEVASIVLVDNEGP